MRNPVFKFSVFLSIVLLASACQSKSRARKELTWYPVVRVVDGDTFIIDDGSKNGKRVRLIGVDTPETVHPRKPVEYYGREASDYVKNLLTNQQVGLEFDVDTTDRYGRLLAYVYLQDGTFLNAHLIEKGYGQIATYPPNVKYVEKFQKLQRKARRKNLGLWGEEE